MASLSLTSNANVYHVNLIKKKDHLIFVPYLIQALNKIYENIETIPFKNNYCNKHKYNKY